MNNLEERFAKADKEFHELILWAIEEEEKITQHLKRKGVQIGLDTNQESYAPIRREYYRRILKIFDKYELSHKPNFDKWIR